MTASAADGRWCDRPATLILNIRPHVWQAAWFLPLVLLLAVGLAALVAAAAMRLRYRRRVKAVEREQALQEERARIAADLHDNLGAGLTEIAMLGDLVSEELRGPEDAERRRLRRIPESARELIRSVDEIVWAINPRNDSLESTASYLAQIAERFQAAGAPLRLDLPQSPPPMMIEGRVRHGLILACQEALNNALRHAGARRIGLSLRVEDGRVMLIVADDGRGFDPGTAPDSRTGHDGLTGMRDRMRKAGGLCTVESSPGQGARVILQWLAPDDAPATAASGSR